jgi:hypothetical protein
MRLWPRRHRKATDEVAVLRRELDTYQQENMRLRLERQRPLSLGKVAAEMRELNSAAADLETLTSSDALDEAYHVLAQAETVRRSVLDAADGLSVAAIQLRRQLTADVPLSEIDRRITERRGVERVESPPEPQSPDALAGGPEEDARVTPVVEPSEPPVDRDVPRVRALIGLGARR